METNPIIESSLLEFHNKPYNLSFPLLLEGESFGLLRIKTVTVPITKKPLFILFTIDKTGSMNESYKNNTKMDYVKQTFKNMLIYLSKKDIDLYIRVHTFDETVSVPIMNTKVTVDTIDKLIKCIDDIQPEGSTNIENALNDALEALNGYSESYPDHQIAHIFMTDGHSTTGNSRPENLFDLVNSEFSNIFVGFGSDHNARLLKKLSTRRNSDYQFVDNMENTSLVYGETINRFLYPAIQNVDIRVTNGLIYNWVTNAWEENFYEPVLVSEIDKIYAIRTSTKDEIKIEVHGKVCSDDDPQKILDVVYSLPELITHNTEEIIENDLSKYIFRQLVQGVLFDSDKLTRTNFVELADFKNKRIRSLFREMRKYMRDNDLMQDKFMILLCDDLRVAYGYAGSDRGRAFILSRQTTQGRQQTYTTNTTDSSLNDEDILIQKHAHQTDSIPILERTMTGCFPRSRMLEQATHNDLGMQQINDTLFSRTNAMTDQQGVYDAEEELPVDYNPEDDINNYVTSTGNISCYATPRTLTTMRSMSQPMDNF